MNGPVWRPVWDVPVRVLHWTLGASFVLCWVCTIEWFAVIGAWHEPAGWLGLIAVVLRVAWGLVAPGRHARLASFVRGPRAVLAHARRVRAGSAPRHVGHNPLGAAMAILLWVCVAALAFTGWLYTTDAFFGDAVVETVHEVLAWAMLALVALHLAGVAFTGRRQRENLVGAMWHGRKRAPQPGDID